MRREWTFQELRAARDLVESGKTWKEAGEALGAHPTTLRNLVKRQGMSPDLSKRSRKPMKYESLIIKAISLRNTTHRSWGMIAVEIEWPLGEHRSVNQATSLRTYCGRYAKRAELDVWRGNPSERYTKWTKKEGE